MMSALQRLIRWFDDLTGLVSWGVGLALHPVPPAQRSAWMYVFGSCTLLVFVAQVVSGTALASAYVTGSGDAYDSLRFITASRLGGLARGMHYYGASAMIVLVGVHAMQVYLAGAYKFPRQWNWLTGAGLLLLTLAMAFTGQLLCWDQTGFWTSVIAAEQAGRTPLLGRWIARFLLAGETAGGATLSRFFAGHVFFAPAGIFALLAGHIYLVLRNGISEPPEPGRKVDPSTYRAWYQDLIRRAGKPFWPEAAWRDVVASALAIACVFALALTLGPPALGRPPDPTIIEASPRPDWYFLWYFAVLSVIPKWSETYVILLGPLMFGLVLFLLPIVAPYGERSPLRRPWAIVFAAGVVIVIATYTQKGHLAPWSPRFDAPRLSAEVVGASSGPIAEGGAAFFDKGCQYCHRVSGSGGIRGPDLTDVGERLTGDQIKARIYSGAENMPSYVNNLTSEQERTLVEFLSSRRPHFSGAQPGTKD